MAAVLFCREHHHFLRLCLKLLSNHLALALAGGVATSILGRQAGPLRNLLFRLMDSSVPDEIQEVSLSHIIFSAYDPRLCAHDLGGGKNHLVAANLWRTQWGFQGKR